MNVPENKLGYFAVHYYPESEPPFEDAVLLRIINGPLTDMQKDLDEALLKMDFENRLTNVSYEN